MTPLRAKMIRELELHRKSPKTIEPYVTAVAQLAQFYHRSPETICLEEFRDFLHHLITVRKVAYSTCNQKLARIRFFYREVLGQQDCQLRVPAKRSGRLPEPLSRGEIARLLDATDNPKHRVLLMTTYGGGLRVSELVCLKPRDIHAERMLIRVDQSKGHKDLQESWHVSRGALSVGAGGVCFLRVGRCVRAVWGSVPAHPSTPPGSAKGCLGNHALPHRRAGRSTREPLLPDHRN